MVTAWFAAVSDPPRWRFVGVPLRLPFPVLLVVFPVIR